jgi:hypothetical protein
VVTDEIDDLDVVYAQVICVDDGAELTLGKDFEVVGS